jgi:hypothetical protein
MDPSELTEGMRMEKLEAGGKELSIGPAFSDAYRVGTKLVLRLDEPLVPGGKTDLEAYWNFTIPNGAKMRMGSIDPSSFFVGYWYPQVSVYDDVDGWDMIDYGGGVEFYNDFADFEVEISAPANFLVWATGTLENADKLLRGKYLDRFHQAATSDEVIHLVEQDDLDGSAPFSKGKKNNTWIYKAKGVSDFAFAMSDHYLWDATSVEVDPATGRRVFIHAAYPESARDFREVAEFSRMSIRDLSTRIPGIPFPYPAMTVFNGLDGGGMEFPMMCNNGSIPFRFYTLDLTYHEIAHTYFPFYMGINEEKYAWMDEGWASVLPNDLLEDEFSSTATYNSYMAEEFAGIAGTESDMPLMTPSYMLSEDAYINSAYYRPMFAYQFLRETLGDSVYVAALQTYIDRWHGKHPGPFDFFFTFDDVAGQDLSWFWKPWFFRRDYPDLGIQDARFEDGQYRITITNKGGLPLAIYLRLNFDDGSEDLVRFSPQVWKEGNKEFVVTYETGKTLWKIKLGHGLTPDSYPGDNKYTWKR